NRRRWLVWSRMGPRQPEPVTLSACPSYRLHFQRDCRGIGADWHVDHRRALALYDLACAQYCREGFGSLWPPDRYWGSLLDLFPDGRQHRYESQSYAGDGLTAALCQLWGK